MIDGRCDDPDLPFPDPRQGDRSSVEDAIPLLQKNTELQPFSPFGWYQLAHAYNRLGRTEQVERTIRQLGGFEPKVARQLERETGVHVGIDVPF